MSQLSFDVIKRVWPKSGLVTLFKKYSSVIFKCGKLLQLINKGTVLFLDTFCVPKSFCHTALLAFILEFQVSIAWSFNPGSLKFLHSTNLPRNLP